MVKKNKRGFIRIIEAIIAIVIVFVYIVNILPQIPKPTGKIPAELDTTLSAILKRVQNDPSFREAVVLDRNMDTIKNFVIGSLPVFSPWKFAFKVCTAGAFSLGGEPECSYYFPTVPSLTIKNEFDAALLGNIQTSIYTKSVFLSQRDVTAPGPATKPCPRTPPSSCPVTEKDSSGNPLPEQHACCENQILSLYMWSDI